MKLDTLLVLLTLWVPVAWCSGSARRRRFHCRGRAATLDRDEGVNRYWIRLRQRCA